jgi:hypothetical protein
VASAPFPQALNREPLLTVRGDIYAGETKTVREQQSVMARLELLVEAGEADDLYNATEGDLVEVGPFAVRCSRPARHGAPLPCQLLLPMAFLGGRARFRRNRPKKEWREPGANWGRGGASTFTAPGLCDSFASDVICLRVQGAASPMENRIWLMGSLELLTEG